MFNSRAQLSSLPLTAFALYVQPHVALASVGAGAGLPYEDTFSKIVTSLTGPWAWTAAIVCALIFAWRMIERGGDLGGSTMGFLGPAFLCTLLLGAKKLMSFFGQGALLTSPAVMLVLGGVFIVGVGAGLLMLAPVTFQLYRSYRRQLSLQSQLQAAAAQRSTDASKLLFFTPPQNSVLDVPQPCASDVRSQSQQDDLEES
jgi:type IV secretion system protein VirB2